MLNLTPTVFVVEPNGSVRPSLATASTLGLTNSVSAQQAP